MQAWYQSKEFRVYVKGYEKPLEDLTEWDDLMCVL